MSIEISHDDLLSMYYTPADGFYIVDKKFASIADYVETEIAICTGDEKTMLRKEPNDPRWRWAIRINASPSECTTPEQQRIKENKHKFFINSTKPAIIKTAIDSMYRAYPAMKQALIATQGKELIFIDDEFGELYSRCLMNRRRAYI